jgi:hypothetical protein
LEHPDGLLEAGKTALASLFLFMKVQRLTILSRTLQELLAPKAVYIYDSEWHRIGDRNQLSGVLADITGINADILCMNQSVEFCSIATRMSWASKRRTTRKEDLAYCLLGIFQINMPLLYGEGFERAFIRLQEEIMKSSYDQSLFAWNLYPPSSVAELPLTWKAGQVGMGILAPHPCYFSYSGKVITHRQKLQPYAMTNRGLQICLPMLHPRPEEDPLTYIGILQCSYPQSLGLAIGIYLVKNDSSEDEYYRNPYARLLEVEHESFKTKAPEDIYVLKSERNWEEKSRHMAKYNCWLRTDGAKTGLKFLHSRYYEYRPHSTTRGPYTWDDGNRLPLPSYAHESSFRTGLFFCKDNDAFILLMKFLCTNDSTIGCRAIGLGIDRVLKTDILSLTDVNNSAQESTVDSVIHQLNLACHPESHTLTVTLPLHKGIITAKLQLQSSFGFQIFVLDVSYSETGDGANGTAHQELGRELVDI